MSDADKIKIYKNAERKTAAPYKPYVPQYQVEGVEPKEYNSAVVPGASVARPDQMSSANPRLRRPMIQPYAEAVDSPIGVGKGPVPNVGNNMEHSWSSVDGQIIDDLSGEDFDPNHPMIDNNDIVTEAALGFRNGVTAQDIQGPVKRGKVVFEMPVETQATHDADTDLLGVLSDLSDEAYLLIVSDVPVCSGPKEEIEDQARALVFGEHEMCDGNPIPIDDIIILKRVKVKVGLFLE